MAIGGVGVRVAAIADLVRDIEDVERLREIERERRAR